MRWIREPHILGDGYGKSILPGTTDQGFTIHKLPGYRHKARFSVLGNIASSLVYLSNQI
jgi:hypothetical protein